MHVNHDVGASLVTSVATGIGVWLWPSAEVLQYAEKLLSVLVIAAVAETARRLVGRFFDRNKLPK